MSGQKSLICKSMIVLASVAIGAATVGCGSLQMTESGAVAGPGQTVVGLKGNVHGGQQPVSGATIQLYQAGLTGYGSLATPLLPTSGVGVVKTGTDGGFTLPSYTCATNSQVYLTATGGNPQVNTSADTNSQIALMAVLGDCATYLANASSTFVQINEETTVAGVWALQQFISIVPGTALSAQPGNGTTTSPSFSIGTSSTNLQGLKNAFATSKVLVDPSSASAAAPGNNTSGTAINVEVWQINTIANILASCVNSDPVTTPGTCSTLETDAKVGATAPSDTLQVATMIAKNPANNVSALVALASAFAPYTPFDSYAIDFTIGYSIQPTANYGVDLGTSSYISFDSYGNAWVANSNVTAANTNSLDVVTSYNQKGFISEFDPTGNQIGVPMYQYNTGSAATPVQGAFGATLTGNGSTKNQPFLVYVDPSNNAWTTDSTNGYVVRIPGSASAGGANGYGASGAGAFAISTGATSKPGSLAIDGNGNVYVSFNNSTATYSSTFGSSLTGVAVIAPAGTTSGPLTGGSMLPDNTAATSQEDYMLIDNTAAGLYNGAPFLDDITQASCTTSGIGLIGQYFLSSGANAGSGSTTTVTADTLTPQNLISATTGASCTTKKSSLPDITVSYNSTTDTLGSGTAVTIPAIYTPLGTAVDGNKNIWILNTNYYTANYPVYGLTKVTPTYTADPVTGALTVSYATTAVNGAGLPLSTTPEYIAIDGANNVWTTGQQTSTVTTPTTGNTKSYGGAMGSFYEWDNNGNPLSPSAPTEIKSGACSGTGSTCAAGWFGGNSNSNNNERASQTRRGIAIDPSGNVWSTDAGSQGKTLFVLVGAAVPTVTPLSLALKNNTIGVRP